jgi:hypothetical protein
VSHTPGPWTAESYPSIKHPNGVWYIKGPAEEDYEGWTNPADARLIAAAPVLLAALEQIAGLSAGLQGLRADSMMMRGVSPVKLIGDARDIARAAIAKATGEPA